MSRKYFFGFSNFISFHVFYPDFEVPTSRPRYTILESRFPLCNAISEGRPTLCNTSSEAVLSGGDVLSMCVSIMTRAEIFLYHVAIPTDASLLSFSRRRSRTTVLQRMTKISKVFLEATFSPQFKSKFFKYFLETTFVS